MGQNRRTMYLRKHLKIPVRERAVSEQNTQEMRESASLQSLFLFKFHSS